MRQAALGEVCPLRQRRRPPGRGDHVHRLRRHPLSRRAALVRSGSTTCRGFRDRSSMVDAILQGRNPSSSPRRHLRPIAAFARRIASRSSIVDRGSARRPLADRYGALGMSRVSGIGEGSRALGPSRSTFLRAARQRTDRAPLGNRRCCALVPLRATVALPEVRGGSLLPPPIRWIDRGFNTTSSVRLTWPKPYRHRPWRPGRPAPKSRRKPRWLRRFCHRPELARRLREGPLHAGRGCAC